ncbi:hypothetical protein [Streptomyces minutiscleroticus]|uniref:hypothetical protein n=1 Tax=Streptomyces minutiscleroticus TaxID=68238 RepID=UPI00331E11B5
MCHTAVRELPAVDAAAITLHGTGLLPHHLAVSSPLPGAPKNCSGPWARARP